MSEFGNKRNVRSWRAITTVFAILAITVLPMGTVNASDSPSATDSPSVQTAAGQATTFELAPDCASLTTKARSYLSSHNIDVCGVGATSTTSAAQAAAVGIACGYASITDVPHHSGYTQLRWNVTSTVGEMSSRLLFVNWNGSNGSAGSINDWGAMLQSSWTNTAVVPSGFSANASLGGSVHIWYGLTCYAVGVHT